MIMVLHMSYKTDNFGLPTITYLFNESLDAGSVNTISHMDKNTSKV